MGPVERKIASQARQRPLCFALIDSESLSGKAAAGKARSAEDAGADAILVGGSSAIDQIELDKAVSAIKTAVKIPVILFPGNVTGISPNADALLFSSLLNSEDPYFITQAQALGALAVKKHGIEAIPMGYLIIGEGTTAWFIGRARGIPFEKPGLAVMHALAAQYMGMRALYLEAGSGAPRSVGPGMVSAVRQNFGGLLIVGGGIRDARSAKAIASAGADIIVVGTAFEKGSDRLLRTIVKSIRSARRRPKTRS